MLLPPPARPRYGHWRLRVDRSIRISCSRSLPTLSVMGRKPLRRCVRPLYLARRVLEQERRQRGRKVYSLHAPEVECIGKGKAHQPYEFGVKVSVATPCPEGNNDIDFEPDQLGRNFAVPFGTTPGPAK